MRLLGTLLGIVIIIITLVDGFETILQPRRVTHRFRFARAFYRSTWRIWSTLAQRIDAPKRRQAFLSTFGPLSLLALFGFWVLGLIVGFGLLHWALRSPIQGDDQR